MATRALVAGSIAVALGTGRASAQPGELGLAWEAPASCPDRDGMRTRIEQRLGRSLDDFALGIEVDVKARGRRYVATIDLGAVTVANDVRTLTSARCDELADAVAVVVARVAREAAAARRVSPRVSTHDLETEVAAPAPAPVRVRRWTIGARLSAVSGIGVVPEVGLGTEIAGYVRHDTTMFELGGTKWLSSSERARYGGPAQIDVGFQVTAARVGWRPENTPLRAWVGVEVGSMNGTGSSVATAQNGAGRWVAAGSGFGVGWQMTRWIRLVGMTEFDIAFERVRFQLQDGVVIYEPNPASARASVGLEVGWQ
jgi:hypothetical protein